jgi:hypothetical protein
VRRRLGLAAAGAAALALAIVLALVGRAVLATPAAVAREGRAWPEGARVHRSHGVAERAAASLLAAGRAERLYAIARAYRRAADSPATSATTLTPVQLADETRRLGSRLERAQAYVLVGAVLALPAGNGSISFDAVRRLGGGRLLDQAAEEFRAAAILDEGNEAAKYDLELLLKRAAMTRASRNDSRRRSAKQHGKQRQRSRRHRRRSTRASLKRHAGAIYSNGSGY